MSNKKWIDHLGNEYKTEREMCEHYNIKQHTFRARTKRGLNVEDALTCSSHSKKIRKVKLEETKDHQGNVYLNKKAMCDAYGIDETNFDQRIRNGKTLQEALLTPVRKRKANNKAKIKKRPKCFVLNEDGTITDVFGRKFLNEKEMCGYYGLTICDLHRRLDHNWLEREALGIPKDENTPFVKELGAPLTCLKEIIEKTNYGKTAIYQELKKGISITEICNNDAKYKEIDKNQKYPKAIFYKAVYNEKIIYIGKTIQPLAHRVSQHKSVAKNHPKDEFHIFLNKHVKSVKFEELEVRFNMKGEQIMKRERQLIAKYDTYYHGMNSTPGGEGVAIAQIKLNSQKKKEIKRLWNMNFSINKIVKTVNLNYRVVHDFLKYDLKVNTSRKQNPRKATWCDHLGNVFPTRKLLCEAYGISVDVYKGRVKLKWPLELILTTPLQTQYSRRKKVIC